MQRGPHRHGGPVVDAAVHSLPTVNAMRDQELECAVVVILQRRLPQAQCRLAGKCAGALCQQPFQELPLRPSEFAIALSEGCGGIGGTLQLTTVIPDSGKATAAYTSAERLSNTEPRSGGQTSVLTVQRSPGRGQRAPIGGGKGSPNRVANFGRETLHLAGAEGDVLGL